MPEVIQKSPTKSICVIPNATPCPLAIKEVVLIQTDPHSDSNSDSDNDLDESDNEYIYLNEESTLDLTVLGRSVEALLQRFHDYMVGPDRQRKDRSIIVVVWDIRRIFQAIGVKHYFLG